MKEFFKKVIEGDGISPSDECLQAFNLNFQDAVNVEWYLKDTVFEALFYKNNIEHIALFNLKGTLMEYSQHLQTEYIPDPIKKIALSKGELMNAVLKNMGNQIEYELIVRDSQLQRFMMLVSDRGELRELRAL